MNRNVEEIKQSMLDNISNTEDKSENSFIHDALAPASMEFFTFYRWLEHVRSKLDIENLEGGELDKYIYQRTGLLRRLATRAIAAVLVSGHVGTIISKGSLVSSGSIDFEVLETKQIEDSGKVEVKALCTESGSIGNVPSGAIDTLLTMIPGVDSVINESAVTNGYDAENDISLLERYYERVRTPSTSGNKHHYHSWAKEVAGVGNARVFSLWQGNNTVKVTIIDSNKQPAGQELVGNVQEYIDPGIRGLGEGAAPIGAFCTIVSAKAKKIDISFKVVKDGIHNIGQIKESVSTSVIKHLKTLAFKTNIVSYAQIGATILESQEVLDYSDLRINQGASNVSIGDEEVATLGTVTVNE